MYCRKCGSNLLDDDTFCYNCGAKIINNNENLSNPKIKEEEKNCVQSEIVKDLPMTWYNFFLYFRIPVAIIGYIASLFIYNFSSFVYDKIEFGMFLITLGLIILFFILFYMMKYKKKNTMKILTAELVLEGISIAVPSMTNSNYELFSEILFVIVAVVWFILNYIYFNKRKHIFIN